MSAPKIRPASDTTSRRTFLGHSARTAAASVLAGVPIPFVHAAEDSAIRLALIGCGGRGGGAVADALSTEGGPVKLWAMADLFEGRLNTSLEALSQSHPGGVEVPPDRRFLGFNAYRHAIDALKPGDVAILATHAAFRPLHFEYAVEKGIHVFMEKSFATDSPALRRLLKSVADSERQGLKVGVGFMWRHSKARQAVIQRIHDGVIGDVHTLRIYRVHGPVVCPRRPSNQNEVAFQLQNPNSFTWVSSGFFIDWHCHNVDVACWTKGAWPIAAQGMGSRTYPEAGNQFDHYTVEYTFPDGAKLFAFARHMNGCWNTYSDYAHGSKGSAVIMDNLAQPRPRIYRSQRMIEEEEIWRFAGDDPNPYQAEWQVLLDAIRQNKPHNESRRAAEANLVGLMGRAATHTGAYVTRDQVMNSEFQFVEDIDRMDFETPAPIHEGPDGLYPAPQPGITREI